MTTPTEALKALTAEGIIPEATAAALLPAPRRKAALCRNHKGSALRENGACTAPAYRVYENHGVSQPDWKLAHNVCEKCLPHEAEFAVPEYTLIVPIR
jgi:hypothetical protein